MRIAAILSLLSLAPLATAIDVVNYSGKTVKVAVAMDTGKNDGGYFSISNGGRESWSRQAPGSTVFIVRDDSTGAKVETVFAGYGQTVTVT
jgi:hypothetical protein